MTIDYRKPTPAETNLFDRLLEGDFPGRNELRHQVDRVLVREIDENGSLELKTSSDLLAPTAFRIPTEGEAKDSDGISVHVLLHVVDGKINELEIYKDDSSPLIKLPDPAEFTLFRPAEKP
jgi:hypothetical protein